MQFWRRASWNLFLESYRTQTKELQKHFSVFYAPEDAEKPAAELAAAKRDGHVEDEGWRVRKDGSRFWANVVITAMRKENGTLYGFSTITRDITERRDHSETLRQSHQEFRDLIERLPTCIIIRRGQAVIYAGLSYAISMLERLIHLNDLTPPPTDRWVRVRFPDRLAEIVDLAAVPGWDAADMMASRRFGDGWLASRRSLILVVPSAVTKQDQNAVINPAHADFPTIEVTSERPVRWDSRLFRRPG